MTTIQYDDIFLVFQGMMCMMLVFVGLQNYFTRHEAYWYYFFHIFCWILYFTIRREALYDWINNPQKLPFIDFLWYFHRVGFPMISYLVYYSFTSQLLELPKSLPKLSRVLRVVQAILLVYVILLVFLALFFHEAHQQFWYESLHTFVRIFLLVISIYIMIQLYQLVDRVKWFFVIGSVSLLFFALIAMVLSILGSESAVYQFWQVPLFYMHLGVISEIICLSLALSYKNKVVENQKFTAEQSLQLEREQREIEALKIDLEKQELGRQMTALRMRALRSQMNPHFLFNSLNAIQECIITNQTDAAVMYLAKFSKLVRLILENSDQQTIPLSREIETLKLYLDVESLRFTHSFSYEINIKTDIDPVLISIPPMLVQPYAENAIWHGLLNKQGERKLVITFESDDESLFVNIEDNGVGRKKSATFDSPMKKSKTSMGMKLTSERLDVLNELNPDQAFVEIIDLVDDKGKAAGTCVKLTLPI
jgi:sensor histidine kinase YesM